MNHETIQPLERALEPSHVVMRRLRTLLREAMRVGQTASAQSLLVEALREINRYIGDV